MLRFMSTENATPSMALIAPSSRPKSVMNTNSLFMQELHLIFLSIAQIIILAQIAYDLCKSHLVDLVVLDHYAVIWCLAE